MLQFGAGGTGAHLILEEAGGQDVTPAMADAFDEIDAKFHEREPGSQVSGRYITSRIPGL